jgi:predicted ester cyclase
LQVASFYEEDGWLSINGGLPTVGRTAIAEVARGFMTEFPDLRVQFDDLVLADDEIRYHWTLTGTSNGPVGTGRQVRISGYEVWTIGTNGLIATSRGHFDSQDYQRQMGK